MDRSLCLFSYFGRDFGMSNKDIIKIYTVVFYPDSKSIQNIY